MPLTNDTTGEFNAYNYANTNIITAGNNTKMLAVGATMPFNVDAQDGAIGEAGTTTSKLQPRFYAFVFPRSGSFDLVNFGLGDNTLFNADRLRYAFWNMSGILLHEHTHDFTANKVDQWTTTPHIPDSPNSPMLPRAFLMGIYPELQADNTADASLIFASSSTPAIHTFGLHENFAAGGANPKTTAGTMAMGFLLSQAIIRPLIWGNLGEPWTSVADKASPVTLGYGGANPAFGGGYQYALRVSMNYSD